MQLHTLYKGREYVLSKDSVYFNIGNNNLGIF